MEKFYEYSIKRIPNSVAQLIVLNVDYELTLFDNNGTLVFSVNKETYKQVKQEDIPVLNTDEEYLIRYNNNDGGNGILNIKMVQIVNNQEINIIHKYYINSISGNTVMNIPFILKLS